MESGFLYGDTGRRCSHLPPGILLQQSHFLFQLLHPAQRPLSIRLFPGEIIFVGENLQGRPHTSQVHTSHLTAHTEVTTAGPPMSFPPTPGPAHDLILPLMCVTPCPAPGAAHTGVQNSWWALPLPTPSTRCARPHLLLQHLRPLHAAERRCRAWVQRYLLPSCPLSRAISFRSCSDSTGACSPRTYSPLLAS